MNSQLSITLLTAQSDIPNGFDCGDEQPDLDLRDFLLREAWPFQRERIASTFLVSDQTGAIVAYFNLLNDSLNFRRLVRSLQEEGRATTFVNHLLRKIHNSKRNLTFPAVKIGRLAVSIAAQRQGIGRIMVQEIFGRFFQQASPAVRFITVDAINRENTLRFYEKLGFRFLIQSEARMETLPMYFDLKALEQ